MPEEVTIKMANLTVREATVKQWPGRNAKISETVKTFSTKALRGPGTRNGGTILNRPSAPAGRSSGGYKRASTARPVLGPMGTQSRTIVP